MKRALICGLFIHILLGMSAHALEHLVPQQYGTITAAVNAASDGDTVLVDDGYYSDTEVYINSKSLIIQSVNGPENCVIDTNFAGRAFFFDSHNTDDSWLSGFTFRHCQSSGTEAGGAVRTRSTDMYITDCIFVENRSNGAGGGLYIGNGIEVEVSNCRFINNSARDGGGIGIGGAGGARIINSLIVNNLCDDDGGGLYSTVGMSLSLCTVAGNTAAARGGGVHVSWTGSITDCIIYDNTAGIAGHSILVPTGTVNCNYSCIEFGYSGNGNILDDPMWEPSHPYYLQPDSPCVDSGSGPASNICYAALSGGFICMSDLTTQLDSTPDTGVVDMGYHYFITTAASTVSAAYSCTPDSGIAPFSTSMAVELANNYTEYLRRVAGRIDARLANMSTITNWRRGYTNLQAGASYTTSWTQSIPALSALIGENVFTLTAVDVTPAPYNQPPYPPAGDWDSDSCTVTAQ